MAGARLYLARGHLYAMAADAEVRRLPLDAAADGLDPTALAEAAAWLRSKPGTGGGVELLLASSRVRFASVPWVVGTFTGRAIRRQVEQDFERTGCAPADWQLGIQWPDYGAPTFVVGYPRALLASVGETLLAAGLVVERSTASAVAVARRHAAALPAGRALLCFGEDDGVSGVHMEDGLVTEVECLALDGSGLDGLDVWCRRKRLEYAGEGRLRWLQAANCPAVLDGFALTPENRGSACASSDLLAALA